MATEHAVEPGKVSWFARGFFALVAIAAFACGFLGFLHYLPAHPEYGRGFLDLSYYSLQLFVLDASPLQTAKDLPPLLEIARFAAPLVTAYLIILATQTLILGRLQQLRIGLLRGHSILCGPPDLTHRLAGQIRHREGGTVVVIGAEPTRPRLLGGFWHLVGDPRQPTTLTRAGLTRAREVITVGTDSLFNAEVAIAVDTVNRERGTTVVCYAEARDRELFEAVVTGSGHIDIFARHDQTARGLLDQLPPFPPSDPRSAVLVIGYSGLGRALVERLTRYWSGEAGPSLCVLDPGVPEAALRSRHGGQFTVTARNGDPAWITSLADLEVPGADGTGRVPGLVYVCLEDDAAAIAVGNVVLRLLAGHDSTVVAAVSYHSLDEPFRPVRELERARLVLVSILGTVYSIAAIRTGTNEALARAIHRAYLAEAIERGDIPATNPSAVPWDDLAPHLQDSNREQAWDIGRKLEMIGCTAVPAAGPITPVTIDEDDVTMLAKVEHVRWMTERRAKGWRHGERDDQRKFHPDLVDWAYLSAESKDKDFAAVRAIPTYLAAAGLTMLRTTSSGR